MKLHVIVVPTVLSVVVITVVTITVTSACVYLCTKKKSLVQKSSIAPSTANGTKDERMKTKMNAFKNACSS